VGVAEWSQGRRHRRHVATVLRSASRVGKDPVVLGSPVIDATDLEIGDGFRVWSAHRQTLITGAGRIRIGNDCFVNAGTIIFSELAVTLGNDVALANEVYVMDSPSHGIEGRNPEPKPVVIGDGTWVGARAIVLPGVTIGRRVAVGAGAVVTRDVPDDVLVAGNPARVVRPLSYPPLCRRAWHDVYCSCPGSLFGPPLAST
jgi:maltose O-acetyltransferase